MPRSPTPLNTFSYYAKKPSGVRRSLGIPHTHTQELFSKRRCVGGRQIINCVIEIYPLAVLAGISTAQTALAIKYLDFIVHASKFLKYQSIAIPAQNVCRI